MTKQSEILTILNTFEDKNFFFDDEKIKKLSEYRNLNLVCLGPRKKEVVKLLFGLEDGKIRNFESVAELFGTKRDTIKSCFDSASRIILGNYIQITTNFLKLDKDIFIDYLNERIL